MKPNIVFLDEYTLGGADLGRLQALGEYKGYARTTPEELPDRCREADVIITNKVVLRRETLQSLPRLRLICVAATGTNNIDLEAAAELGIEVKNAAGYSTHSVAETTLGAAIALRRNIVYYDRYVKSGAYSAAGQQFHFALPTHQLYGSKWGIVGLGAIGREVARLAAAFGCEVCYTSTSGVVREEPYPALPLTELLGRSDIVSIHAPLNDRTRGLIGAPELSVMKRSALLINVARGGIVDEAALAEALDRGSIAGAALDVFSREPFAADSPLLGIREPDRLLRDGWTYCKLFSLPLIRREALRFDTGLSICEDLVFVLGYLSHVRQIILRSGTYYHYQVCPDGTSLSQRRQPAAETFRAGVSILAKQQALTERFGITDPEYLAEAYSEHGLTNLARSISTTDAAGNRALQREIIRNRELFRQYFDADSMHHPIVGKKILWLYLTLPESLHLLPHWIVRFRHFIRRIKGRPIYY